MTQHHTIHDDYLISLIDGKPYTLLKAHIRAHGYTAQSYREAFGLPEDYPMTPPNYGPYRAALSRRIDHTNRWDPNTNMRLSERRATGAPYRSRLNRPPRPDR